MTSVLAGAAATLVSSELTHKHGLPIPGLRLSAVLAVCPTLPKYKITGYLPRFNTAVSRLYQVRIAVAWSFTTTKRNQQQRRRPSIW